MIFIPFSALKDGLGLSYFKRHKKLGLFGTFLCLSFMQKQATMFSGCVYRKGVEDGLGRNL